MHIANFIEGKPESRNYTTSTNGIAFAEAYIWDSFTAMSLNNGTLIPYQIYGIKTMPAFSSGSNTSNTDLVNMIYPIGSIYMSVNSTNPATLFGGTWERIQDRFLLAAGSSYSAGSTGGEAQHTLTVEEMPSHTHTGSYNENIMLDTGKVNAWGSPIKTTGTSEYTAQPGQLSNIGGNQPHNNMPPYLAVYMWKRTA